MGGTCQVCAHDGDCPFGTCTAGTCSPQRTFALRTQITGSSGVAYMYLGAADGKLVLSSRAVAWRAEMRSGGLALLSGDCVLQGGKLGMWCVRSASQTSDVVLNYVTGTDLTLGARVTIVAGALALAVSERDLAWGPAAAAGTWTVVAAG